MEAIWRLGAPTDDVHLKRIDNVEEIEGPGKRMPMEMTNAA